MELLDLHTHTHELTPRLKGWDAMNIEEIYTYLYRHRFYRGGEVLMSAISGVDIALWYVHPPHPFAYPKVASSANAHVTPNSAL
jgi:hypothetical protein